MLRFGLTITAGLLAMAGAAFAQVETGLEDQTPAENVTGGAVRGRAPGLIVNTARAAHSQRAAERLAAQRAGDTSVLAPEEVATAFSSGSNGGLTDLVGDLLGGVTGLDLGGLLGGLTGNTGTTTGTGTGTTGEATGGTGNIPSNITPEAIALLEANGFDVNELFAQTRETPEVKQVTQDATTEEPRFMVRWADSILSQMFFALTTTLNSSLFVDFLVDAITPEGTSTTDDGTASDNDGTDGTPVDVDRDPNSIVLWPRALPALA